MSDALPNKPQNSTPAPEARPGVSHPVPGMAPAWEDPPVAHFIEDNMPASPAGANESERWSAHGLTLERGGRSGMTGTAERIGSAVGTAQRQMRRGLELVRGGGRSSAAETPSAVEDAANEAARALEEQVTELRGQSAERMDEWSAQAGEHLRLLRRELSSMLSLLRERAQQLGDEYPLQTIGAIAGACFVLGVALRIGRSHRG